LTDSRNTMAFIIIRNEELTLKYQNKYVLLVGL
jgi:hypothetical protein